MVSFSDGDKNIGLSCDQIPYILKGLNLHFYLLKIVAITLFIFLSLDKKSRYD